MKKTEHFKIDRFLWDEEFPDVHQWLDECYSQFAARNPYRHWLKRHHLKAIRKKYGKHTREYNVAYIHILFDFLNAFEAAEVPRNEKDVSEWLRRVEML